MEDLTTAPTSPFADKGVKLSALACGAGFLLFLIWGGFAKLDEGVTASGHVVVEDNRKQIQHLEGGIIRQVTVREGETVDAGTTLVELEPLQSETARDELAQEYAAHAASLARLSALWERHETLDLSILQSLDLGDVVRRDIDARQTELFTQERTALAAELDVLRIRKITLEGRVRDLSAEIAATRDALATAEEDLSLREELLSEKLETIGNVQQLRRQVSDYRASLSRLIGDRNEAEQTAEETAQQIAETEARQRREISERLVEAQRQSLAAREQLLALDDRLARTTIRAPQAGRVLNLTTTTLGGVIAPGDVIMEIVPQTDELIVTLRLSPTDRDAVAPDQTVEAQLTAYKSFVAPRLPGRVMSISADLKEDEATGAPYYEARVKLDASSLSPESRIQIIPGMPVDAFIASGTSRTFLDYVFEPIRATFTRGTRMS